VSAAFLTAAVVVNHKWIIIAWEALFSGMNWPLLRTAVIIRLCHMGHTSIGAYFIRHAPHPTCTYDGHEGGEAPCVEKQQTKLYWPSRNRSPKWLNCICRTTKVKGHDKKIRVWLSTFKFVPAPLTTSFLGPVRNSARGRFLLPPPEHGTGCQQNSSRCVPRQSSSVPWKRSCSRLPTVGSIKLDSVMRRHSSCIGRVLHQLLIMIMILLQNYEKLLSLCVVISIIIIYVAQYSIHTSQTDQMDAVSTTGYRARGALTAVSYLLLPLI